MQIPTTIEAEAYMRLLAEGIPVAYQPPHSLRAYVRQVPDCEGWYEPNADGESLVHAWRVCRSLDKLDL